MTVDFPVLCNTANLRSKFHSVETNNTDIHWKPQNKAVVVKNFKAAYRIVSIISYGSCWNVRLSPWKTNIKQIITRWSTTAYPKWLTYEDDKLPSSNAVLIHVYAACLLVILENSSQTKICWNTKSKKPKVKPKPNNHSTYSNKNIQLHLHLLIRIHW